MRIGRAEKRTEKIVGVVAVVAVVLSGSSYWTGSRVEQEFREGIAWAAGQGVAVSVVDYQRGVFGATARTDVVFQMPSLDDPSITESVTVPIVHEIRHGPLATLTAAARIHSEAQATEDSAAYFDEIFGGDPFEGKAPLVIDTVIGWAGGRHSRIVSPKFEAVIKEDQTRVSWGGLNGELSVSSGFARQKANIVMEGLSFFKSDEDMFQIGRLTLKADADRIEGFRFISVGTTDIVLDKFHFSGKSESGAVRRVELSNFHVVGEASVKDGALGAEVKFDAGSIVTKGDAQETVDGFRLVFSLENIDAKAYDAILQAVHDNEDPTPAMAAVFQEQSGILLQRKPVLLIKNASGRWPEGMVTGSFRIAYAGDGNPEDMSISSLSGDLQMEVPRALVIRHMSTQVAERITDSLEDGEENEVNVEEETKKQVDKQMAAMLAEGIFVEKADALTVDAHLQNGELNLNGKPKQIENLFKLIPPFF